MQVQLIEWKRTQRPTVHQLTDAVVTSRKERDSLWTRNNAFGDNDNGEAEKAWEIQRSVKTFTQFFIGKPFNASHLTVLTISIPFVYEALVTARKISRESCPPYNQIGEFSDYNSRFFLPSPRVIG